MWEWLAKGVKVDDKEFTFRIQPEGAIEGWCAEMQEAREIDGTLSAAEIGFSTGRGFYVGAVENLRHLRREKLRSSALCGIVANQIGQFFDPEGVCAAIGRDGLPQFVSEAMEKLPR